MSNKNNFTYESLKQPRTHLKFPLEFDSNGAAVRITDTPLSKIHSYLSNCIVTLLSNERYVQLYRPEGPKFRDYVGRFDVEITHDLVYQDLKEYFNSTNVLPEVSFVDVVVRLSDDGLGHTDNILTIEAQFTYKPTNEILSVDASIGGF